MPRDAASRASRPARGASPPSSAAALGVETVVVVGGRSPHAQVVGALEHDAVERAVREQEARERRDGLAGEDAAPQLGELAAAQRLVVVEAVAEHDDVGREGVDRAPQRAQLERRVPAGAAEVDDFDFGARSSESGVVDAGSSVGPSIGQRRPPARARTSRRAPARSPERGAALACAPAVAPRGAVFGRARARRSSSTCMRSG